MTPAALLISLAGLSHQEAADFLNVRLDTVKSWCRKNQPNFAKPGVIDELKTLIAAQEWAANGFLIHLTDLTSERGSPPDCVEIGYPTDDHESQTLGLPCVGAWSAMAARVVARSSVPVRLVPRGSTVATAAAIQAHEK